jgi:hypothetical protein
VCGAALPQRWNLDVVKVHDAMQVEIMTVDDRGKSDSWVVRRQDDNGNRFVVRTGLSCHEAKRVAAELEGRGHKQLYWVELESVDQAGRLRY